MVTTDFFTHPDYNQLILHNDLALVHLPYALNFTGETPLPSLSYLPVFLPALPPFTPSLPSLLPPPCPPCPTLSSLPCPPSILPCP